MQLCKMAEAVLAAVSGPSSTLVPSEQFRRARQIFFADYAYVLRLTGPGFADMEAKRARRLSRTACSPTGAFLGEVVGSANLDVAVRDPIW